MLGDAVGQQRIHYRRPAGDYGDPTSADYADFWGLHTWEGAADPGWTTPRRPVGQDPFGLVYEVPLVPDAEWMGYILHRGDEKDPGPDLILDFEEDGYEVWQLQGADPASPYVLPTPDCDCGGPVAPERAEDPDGWSPGPRAGGPSRRRPSAAT